MAAAAPQPGFVGAAQAMLDGYAGDLFRQGDRQLAPGESGRSQARTRNAAVRRGVGLLVPAGDDLCLAALQGHRVRLQESSPAYSATRTWWKKTTPCNWKSRRCATRRRIDVLARQMGMQSPQAGQVIRMDASCARLRRAGDGKHGAGGGDFGAIKVGESREVFSAVA